MFVCTCRELASSLQAIDNGDVELGSLRAEEARFNIGALINTHAILGVPDCKLI